MLVYKQDSFLDNDVVRVINYILLGFTCLLCTGIREQLSYLQIMVLFSIAVFAAGMVTYIAINNTDYAKTYEEYKRRCDYSFTYLISEFVLCFLLVLLIREVIIEPFKWVIVIPIAVLVFNILNLPTLHFWMFKDHIRL